MDDLISRQAAIDDVCMLWCNVKHQDCKHPFELEKHGCYWCEGCETALRTLPNLPSAQPERKKGKWMGTVCSACGESCSYHFDAKYCPNCGADMRDEKDIVKWHKYPEERPNEEGRYLVCYPTGMIPDSPHVSVAYWGKSHECEWSDKSLKQKKAYWYSISDEYGNYTIDDVYAWMPLPVPMPLPNERKETKR